MNSTIYTLHWSPKSATKRTLSETIETHAMKVIKSARSAVFYLVFVPAPRINEQLNGRHQWTLFSDSQNRSSTADSTVRGHAITTFHTQRAQGTETFNKRPGLLTAGESGEAVAIPHPRPQRILLFPTTTSLELRTRSAAPFTAQRG